MPDSYEGNPPTSGAFRPSRAAKPFQAALSVLPYVRDSEYPVARFPNILGAIICGGWPPRESSPRRIYVRGSGHPGARFPNPPVQRSYTVK